MRREYDFASMKSGIRGKYVKRFREGTNLVLLDPDVAEAFTSDVAVNEALRAVLRAATMVGPRKGLSNKPMQRTARSAHRR